ncbi:uncharacterized protein (DUF305 family) [Novosphingobium kunmingense]|uniref:Uncharacterized protein (DUF305 family) n=1 Tax=Novosphingobium kunmingense TaxID=1211806 RepID=A0A2N0HJX1_9SPHN|nr:DUF305 domain-containing protein [Novosphingobium kunmingense]PKB19254.1 uncharacterized protein (DUF305 family) [Novosphingobium kunmingense]
MRTMMRLALAGLLATTATSALAQTAPIVLPGAPGQPGRTITPADAIRLANASYSPADVAFMQHMIVHHQQAVDMAALVKTRTNNPDVVSAAGRIDASQADEMKFMRKWLADRSEPLAMPAMNHAAHAGHDMAAMPAMAPMKGMATPEQMAALANASGTAFDRLFLQLMIAHHRGALDMVQDLLKSQGSAYDPAMFQFTTDVTTDQKAEIDRMNKILAGLSGDPRATLKPGFRDAGEAALNMRKIASLAKPDGFFDPKNPGALFPLKAKKDDEAKKPAPKKVPAKKADVEPPKPEFAERWALLGFMNTDIAFSGDVMVAGSYHGFNTYRLGTDGVPSLVSSVVCPGGQGDVSIVGNLLVMSVEEPRGRKDCGLQGVTGRVSADRFRGIRLFDIADLANPRQVGQVQTCRGSHTHSVVDANSQRIVLYASGTGHVRDSAELAGCVAEGGDDTALFSIDVIEVPVANPAAARIVDRPRVFAAEGKIAGLWRGGDHGEGTQNTEVTDQCHDITVFPAKKLAAGACSGNGILMDIADPLKPKRIDDVSDKSFAYWHSATFNNDGTKVLFTDEWGGGMRPRCQAGDPQAWGADAFYGIENGKLVYRGHFKLPAPQTDKENCVAHNGSIVPVPGRDIFVQAWYQGGISVIDFTDATKPREIAYFDRGPIDKDQLILGGYWSAYWYKGRIYATEIGRGIDVFKLEPSAFLSAEEIAAAEAAIYPGNGFNPQTQTQVTWPEGVAAKIAASRK